MLAVVVVVAAVVAVEVFHQARQVQARQIEVKVRRSLVVTVSGLGRRRPARLASFRPANKNEYSGDPNTGHSINGTI